MAPLPPFLHPPGNRVDCASIPHQHGVEKAPGLINTSESGKCKKSAAQSNQDEKGIFSVMVCPGE